MRELRKPASVGLAGLVLFVLVAQRLGKLSQDILFGSVNLHCVRMIHNSHMDSAAGSQSVSHGSLCRS